VKVRVVRDGYLKTGNSTGADALAIQYMLYITALIAEHLNLDKIAQTDDLVKSELKKITQSPLYEYLFNVYLDFARMGTPQLAPSLCLGSLFRAYPVLILQEGALEWMDGVFGGRDVDMQGRLLGVIWEFLKSEAEKKNAGVVGVKGKGGKGKKGMDALIGDTSDLSESG
jgi:cohesin loading factor subunit SCC2